jgi:glycosyltransferase involved in cell wall biosynthesis
MTKIFHILPQNSTVSGGIKVHFQLAELEKELGYDSFVAFPNKQDVPKWFQYSCPVIDYADAKALSAFTSDSIYIGWEDPAVLEQFSGRRVCYIQGECFVNRNEPYTNRTLWFSSDWNKKQVRKAGDMVTPYIDTKRFYTDYGKFNRLGVAQIRVIVQSRKSGVSKWQQVQQYVPGNLQDRLVVEIVDDCSEEEFATKLRGADVFFAHSFPEGLGLPPLEAMASGTIVVGYTGGGGTDFMVNAHNCYWTQDGNAAGVAKALCTILTNYQNVFPLMAENALAMVQQKYSVQNTRLQLEAALKKLGV